MYMSCVFVVSLQRHRITKAEKGDDADGRGKFIKVGGIVRLRTDIELNGATDDNGTGTTPDLLASIGKKQVLSSLNPNERKRAADKKVNSYGPSHALGC